MTGSVDALTAPLCALPLQPTAPLMTDSLDALPAQPCSLNLRQLAPLLFSPVVNAPWPPCFSVFLEPSVQQTDWPDILLSFRLQLRPVVAWEVEAL